MAEVEFEGRSPEFRDLPGMAYLLNQCFRGSKDVNLKILTWYVLKQRSVVGSVLSTVKGKVLKGG